MIECTKKAIEELQSFKTEGDYRQSPSLNYSTLKELDNGPACLVSDGKTLGGDAIISGNYVDTFFTNREMLHELYEVGKPIIVLPESLEILFQFFVAEGKFEPSTDECVKAIRQLKLWDSIKDQEKLLSRVTPDFYRKLIEESEKTNKIRLTADQLAKANNAIDNITHNEAAVELLAEGDDEVIVNQFKWEFELNMDSGRKRMFRAMYDKIKFIPKDKKVIGIDIKTGAKPSHMFGDSVFDYRYDVQGILYFFGLMSLVKKHFQGWTIEFKFVYGPKIANSAPVVVNLDESFMAEHLITLTHKGKTVPGILSLMNDADWYIENQEFTNHRMLVENNGIVTMSNLI